MSLCHKIDWKSIMLHEFVTSILGDHGPQVTETRQKATPRWDFQLIRNGYNAEILTTIPYSVCIRQEK